MAVSGGFRTTVGGLRISARSPLPIAFLAFTNAALWLSAARRQGAVSADLEAAWHGIERHATRLIVAIAIASATVTAIYATRSAAGADASGYISQAAMWARGLHFTADPLQADLNDQSGWLTTPLGWRPAGVAMQAPSYPPGLPLLMAIPHALGGVSGASAIVTLSAAVAAIATGLLAAQFGGGIAGVVAALILAFTPVFLYQAIQPMSDVPVTAAWMVCLLLLVVDRSKGTSAQRQRLCVWSGIACAVAVLIRPNLAPLAIVPLMLARNRIAFAMPVAIAGILLGSLQWIWYGSPWRSGYGSADELFALGHIAGNVPRYFSWLVATSPILFLSIFGFWRLRRDRSARALLAFAALVIGAYLIYAVFDDWSYLRFLLPALAVLAIFTAIELTAWMGRWPVRYRAPICFVLVLVITSHAIWVARSRDTFKLADQLRRVASVADYINADVPPAAVILAGEQSGSMRYYADRSILRWEAATPQSLASAIATLEQSRRPVYIVLDAWENEPFRAKFGSLPAAALDWPPMLEAGTSHRTRLWKLSDRDRFQRGERLNTLRLP